jgi:hypothetical protein
MISNLSDTKKMKRAKTEDGIKEQIVKRKGHELDELLSG